MTNNKWYINRLYISNFKPFISQIPPLEINFHEAGQKGGFIMLSGPNGYGKTTIFQAVEFVLLGYIEISPLKDKTKTYSEHLGVHDLEKESLVAVEFANSENEYFVAIRHNPCVKACSETDCDGKEWKDYKLYIINGRFDYSVFSSLLSNQKIEVADSKELGKKFGEKSLKEWISSNYIQQDQVQLLLNKSSAARVDFVNSLVDKQSDAYKNVLVESKENIENEIKKFKKKLEEINTKMKNYSEATIGKEPEQIRVFEDENYFWDKIEYSKNENLDDTINIVEELQTIWKHKELYALHCKKDLVDAYISDKELLYKIIIEVCLGEQKGAYLEKSKRYNHYCDIEKKGILNSEIKENYFDKNFFETVAKLKRDKEHIQNISSEEEKLYQLIGEARKMTLKDKKTADDLFGKVCPMCGSRAEEILLSDKIENYEKSYAEIRNKLNASINELNCSLNESLGVLEGKLKNLIHETTSDSWVSDRALQIQKEQIKIRDDIKKLEEILNYKLRFDKLNMKQEAIKEKSEELIARLEEIRSSIIIEIERTDNDSSFREDLLKKHLEIVQKYINDTAVDLLSRLEKKRTFLEWLSQKRKVDELSKVQNDYRKVSLDFKLALEKREKIKKILNADETANKRYMEDLVRYIEIPLYIYSGKLLQLCQINLGVFCNTGSDINKLTRFKLTTNAQENGHDVINKLSSGQKAILNVALILAFKKVRRTNLDIFMVDDPCQSLDTVNIASFADILRNEFKDTQIFMSTHDDNIAGYMCYKNIKAKKKAYNFHVQKELYKVSET